jgi:hypothetical protein
MNCQHAVTPRGKLRFALTCRYVRPETMQTDDDRRQTAIKSKLPAGHEKYNYDGDINAHSIVLSDQALQSIENSTVQKRRSLEDVKAMIIAGEISRNDLCDLSVLLQANILGVSSFEANENDGEEENQPGPLPFTDIFRDTPMSDV